MDHTIQRIKTELDRQVEQMAAACDRFPWDSKLAYADLLAQTYFYSRHTTRILGLAGVHFGLEAVRLHNRFLRHAAEETGHENLAQKDLKALGFDLNSFSESAFTSALYQCQYYWVQHKHPASIFGYILSLEAFAAVKCAWMYSVCKEKHGESASHFWRVHSEEDPDHLEKALSQVSNLPTEVFPLVEENLYQTAFYYRNIFDEITKRSLRA